MGNEKVGRRNASLVETRLKPIRLEIDRIWLGWQCSRCAKVDELFEELIRKQIRDAQPPRSAAMGQVLF